MTFDEWEKGDFRPIAEIYRHIQDLFKDQEINYYEYDEEGMGRIKVAFFHTSNNIPFIVEEYLDTTFPLTLIHSLNDSKTIRIDI